MLWGGLFYNISNIHVPVVHEISAAGWYVSSQSSSAVYKFLLEEAKKTDTQFDDVVFSVSSLPFYLSAGFMEGLRKGIHGK
jgi:cytosine/uracil/thiamine/allantoin permease